MKNLQSYANRPQTEYPSFWTEDWLKIAISELDTRRFTPEQYERYAITLAHNASVIQQEQANILKARMEERTQNAAKEEGWIFKMSTEGFTVQQIAKVTQKSTTEIEQIIESYTHIK